jgi:hypothetical protein
MQTTMRVSEESRDTLARIARTEYGGATLDEALRRVLFEHDALASVQRLAADPQALAEYRAEAGAWAELDMADPDPDHPW